MSSALAVFVKRPVPGRVKTRLHPDLTPEEAAHLYWAMARDVWTIAASLEGVEPILFVDELWEGFHELAQGRRLEIQAPGELGGRMFQCFQYLNGQQFNKKIIIGSDSPTLSARLLSEAFRLLEQADDAVLGPTEDGGYYLVGCQIPQEGMFAGVPWSTPETFDRTLASLKRCGYRVGLAPRFRDVDTFEDVLNLRGEMVGPEVRGWLDRFFPGPGREVFPGPSERIK